MISAVVAISIAILSRCFATQQTSSSLQPCPNIKEQKIYDIQKVLGEWYLALMLMDEQSDQYDYQEQDSCVHGELHLINSTTLTQLWYIYSTFSEYGATVYLPTKIVHPNQWEIMSPLGGVMNITISHISPGSHMTLTFCSMQYGKLVHLWTALLTRQQHFRPAKIVEFTLELLMLGFDLHKNQLIRGNYC